MQRIGLVVHPSRSIDRPLATLREWAAERGIEVVQLKARDDGRQVAPFGELQTCDLVVAIGGDGTVLTALRAAAPSRTAVLGVACGSVGALSAVRAPDLAGALDQFEAGTWAPRELRALEIAAEGGSAAWAVNDFVLVRRVGQLVVEISAGGELYARIAGDGVIVATALGSSAYSMAAGGPVLATDTPAFVVTPLVMHGGSAPPLVVPSGLELTLVARPGYAGFDIEVDGHPEELEGTRFAITLAASKATLVSVGAPGHGLAALRRRGLIADSPRVLARDERAESG